MDAIHFPLGLLLAHFILLALVASGSHGAMEVAKQADAACNCNCNTRTPLTCFILRLCLDTQGLPLTLIHAIGVRSVHFFLNLRSVHFNPNPWRLGQAINWFASKTKFQKKYRYIYFHYLNHINVTSR